MTTVPMTPVASPAADAKDARPSPEHSAELVVIGCDGSDAGRPAVLFAVREALLRGAPLRAVAAYGIPTMAYGFGMAAAVWSELPRDLAASLDLAVRAQVEEVRASLGGTLEVEVHVAQGHPAAILLAASKDAALLVVGARGHGAWGRMMLGSTSTEVVHHSAVPVVVVPCLDPA